MCGITGFINPKLHDAQEMNAQVQRMADQLAHRGPDDSGAWVDAGAGLAFGFRRLSIIDLSPAGSQPMVSQSGRYVVVFNGEIYNFVELRHNLQRRGCEFRGHSDTEVMLAAMEERGIEVAVKEFVGMFAFALWDRRERMLHLVRDRLGVKPLYYGWTGAVFLFGSELKALRAHPEFAAAIDRTALALHMRYGYVPQPYSIYRGIHKLRPGCILTLGCGGSSAPETRAASYWSVKEIAERGAAEPFRGSEEEARDQLDALLRESVRLRMIADVPLGAFLSGGIDSSTVVALMQAQSSRPVKTFTIGFHEPAYNEAVHARAVAAHLGTEHTELYLTPDETRAVIPKLPELFDEPFSDSSQIPTHLVSALARRHVTVSLSGDGGDELFAGYNRYFLTSALWTRGRWLPRSLRVLLARLIAAQSPGTYNRWLGALVPWADRYGRPGPLGEKMHKFAEAFAARNPEELYLHFVSQWKEPVVLGAGEPVTGFSDRSQQATLSNLFQWMMSLDLITYLPDDILTKVDRASMGVSLEARVPILDHRVAEFAARLPVSMKVRDGQGKWLLRQVLYRYVPRALIERSKMGFSVPIDSWLRGPLRDWAEDLLSQHRLEQEGYLNPELVRQTWAEHLGGERNRQEQLWDVLMFESWLERWG